VKPAEPENSTVCEGALFFRKFGQFGLAELIGQFIQHLQIAWQHKALIRS